MARFGGDEFAVVLAGLSKNETEAVTGVETVVQKISASLARAYQLEGNTYHSTASIGVTLLGDGATTVDELLQQADLAMYKSKEVGRDAWRFFHPRMQAAAKESALMKADLRRALMDRQFVLHYQAQVLGERRVTGAEALIRWQHTQRGLQSPAEFIPLAEETGLILPLGHWVLETACIQLAKWAAQPKMAHLTLSVNVSVHQFRQADFVDQVLTVLRNTSANPQRLKLELTESLLVDNVHEVIGKMMALKTAGVSFSLDDFGTGYFSLSYLRRLPLDELKIDQSFVHDVLIEPTDASIAKTIVALAQNLGLGVIAEGVETEGQRDFLASCGCRAYQGFFFSRALPVDDFDVFAQQI